MTVTCARCHDHKFDPISQDDYYGLYGIFQSTRYPFPGIELDKKPRDFVPLVENGKPSETLAYAMAEGNAEDAAVHLRGEPNNLGDVIPRRFLEVLGGQMLSGDECQTQRAIAIGPVADCTDNPLTARVMVNRIWQYHFGTGLVKTPSDFGVRGLPPTHPELLDWLASRFIADGWSMKKLHRRIMLSRTYQLTSRRANRIRMRYRPILTTTCTGGSIASDSMPSRYVTRCCCSAANWRSRYLVTRIRFRRRTSGSTPSIIRFATVTIRTSAACI